MAARKVGETLKHVFSALLPSAATFIFGTPKHVFWIPPNQSSRGWGLLYSTIQRALSSGGVVGWHQGLPKKKRWEDACQLCGWPRSQKNVVGGPARQMGEREVAAAPSHEQGGGLGGAARLPSQEAAALSHERGGGMMRGGCGAKQVSQGVVVVSSLPPDLVRSME